MERCGTEVMILRRKVCECGLESGKRNRMHVKTQDKRKKYE